MNRRLFLKALCLSPLTPGVLMAKEKVRIEPVINEIEEFGNDGKLIWLNIRAKTDFSGSGSVYFDLYADDINIIRTAPLESQFMSAGMWVIRAPLLSYKYKYIRITATTTGKINGSVDAWLNCGEDIYTIV